MARVTMASGSAVPTRRAQRAARAARLVALSEPVSVARSEPLASSTRAPSSAATVRARAICASSAEPIVAATTATSRFCSPVIAGAPARTDHGAGSPEPSGPSASRARVTAAPSAGRSAGSRASSRATSASSASGTSGRSSLTRGASARRSCASTAITCSPGNARRPVRHWKSTAPSENTSARASTRARSPRACSGAM